MHCSKARCDVPYLSQPLLWFWWSRRWPNNPREVLHHRRRTGVRAPRPKQPTGGSLRSRLAARTCDSSAIITPSLHTHPHWHSGPRSPASPNGSRREIENMTTSVSPDFAFYWSCLWVHVSPLRWIDSTSRGRYRCTRYLFSRLREQGPRATYQRHIWKIN